VPRYQVLAAGELIGHVELPDPRRPYQIATALLQPVAAYERLRPVVRDYTALLVDAFTADFESDRLREAGLAPSLSYAEIRKLWEAAEAEEVAQRFSLRDFRGRAVDATVRLVEAPPEGSRVKTTAADGRPGVEVRFGPRPTWLDRWRRALRRSVNV
jgi:hypothetical protein